MLGIYFSILLYLISIITLAIGFWLGNKTISESGAYLFLTVEVFRLIRLYLAAKSFKADETETDLSSIPAGLLSLARNILIIAGLILAITRRNEGFIIWVGYLTCYALSGIIIQVVADIPLEMTYGGWSVRSRRRQK